MIRFNCDYSEGAHEKVLERLIATNREQTQGYGTDHYSVQAKELIRRLCGRMDADVHFLVGGTQANLTVISAGLRPYQGVIAADTGHINVHETGAIEACGHKILALPSGCFPTPHHTRNTPPGRIYQGILQSWRQEVLR